MKEKRLSQISQAVTLILALAVTAASWIYIAKSDGRGASDTQVILTSLFLILLAFSFSLGVRITYSVKRKVCTYRNVGLVGAAISIDGEIIALLIYFLSCIRDRSRLTNAYLIELVMNTPKYFSLYTMAVVCVISLLICVSNLSLVRHEGMRPKNLLGAVLGGVFVLAIVLFFAIDAALTGYLNAHESLLNSPVAQVIHRVITMFLMIGLSYFECFLFGTIIIGYLATNKNTRYDRDAVVILGCHVGKNGEVYPLFRGRIDAAVRFAEEQTDKTDKRPVLIPSGCRGNDEGMSEGEAAAAYLKETGCKFDVYPEVQSRNTRENVMFSRVIADGVKKDAALALATTNYHVLRSCLIAEELEIDATGVPAKTKWYFWPNGFVREFFALVKMKKKQHLTAALISASVCTALSIAIGLIAH